MKKALRWLAVAMLSIWGLAAKATKLPFLQDDFGKAKAEGMQRKLPIFIEVWAPW